MGFLTKLIAKILLNGGALYVARIYVPGFLLAEGSYTLAFGGLVLALLNIFVRPLLRFIASPLVWITFGLFNIVIHVAILWIADTLLTQLTITSFSALFWAAIIIAIANIFI